MGTRTKTFDATGIAPGGKLYAGDLNAIQDDYADLSNFSQIVDVSSIRIGDSSLAITKFGTGEIQFSAHGKFSGQVRPAKGVVNPTFTTTQRNAIPVGEAVTGTIIWNSTTSQLEVNVGTDGARVWMPASSQADAALFVGMPVWYPAELDHTQSGIVEPEPGWLYCNGATLNRAGTYAALFAKIGIAYGAPDGSTFKLPDCRNGREPIGKGTAFPTRGATGGAETVALAAAEMPVHTHVQDAHTHAQVAHSHSHSHGFTTGTESADHSHNTTIGHNVITTGAAGGSGNRVTGLPGDSGNANSNPTPSGGRSSAHTHSGATDTNAATATATNNNATATNQNAGGGTAHTNRSPFVVVGGYVMRYK